MRSFKSITKSLNKAIHDGRLIVKSKGILSALTPDISTANGSLKAEWYWSSGSLRGLPGYYKMFDGHYEVKRNDKVIWIHHLQGNCEFRMRQLFAKELGIRI